MKPDISKKEFRRVLLESIAGSHEALEELLLLYMPLINRYSYINGRLDEDLRQYIMIHIALNISKFQL